MAHCVNFSGRKLHFYGGSWECVEGIFPDFFLWEVWEVICAGFQWVMIWFVAVCFPKTSRQLPVFFPIISRFFAPIFLI